MCKNGHLSYFYRNALTGNGFVYQLTSFANIIRSYSSIPINVSLLPFLCGINLFITIKNSNIHSYTTKRTNSCRAILT